MFTVPFMPPDLSTHGAGLDSLNSWVHVLMAILFVGWGAFFVYTLVRFRRGANPKASHAGVTGHTSSYLEAGVALFEVVLLFGLAIPLWGNWIDPAEESENPVQVNVIAQQFAWNIHYPGADGKFGRLDYRLVDGVNGIGRVAHPQNLDFDPASDPGGLDDFESLNRLVVPVNRDIVIRLTSKDVIHSFFLPVMRVKQDAIPGDSVTIRFQATKTNAEYKRELLDSDRERVVEIRATQLWREQQQKADPSTRSPASYDEALQAARGETDEQLLASIPDFEIACAQLCGAQHFAMVGKLVVVSEAEYEAWTQSMAPQR